jgi:hypothetical protein
MGAFHTRGGLAARIEAIPSKLPAHHQSAPLDPDEDDDQDQPIKVVGDVYLECRNRSLQSYQVVLDSISVRDQTVASASSSARSPIPVPARSSRYTCKQQGTGTELIATWSPKLRGSTMLKSRIHVHCMNIHIDTLNPDTDVESL